MPPKSQTAMRCPYINLISLKSPAVTAKLGNQSVRSFQETHNRVVQLSHDLSHFGARSRRSKHSRPPKTVTRHSSAGRRSLRRRCTTMINHFLTMDCSPCSISCFRKRYLSIFTKSKPLPNLSGKGNNIESSELGKENRN